MNEALSPSRNTESVSPRWSGVRSFSAYIAILCLITWAVTFAHCTCEAPTIKRFLCLCARWLPWLVCGIAIGYSHPKRSILLGCIFFAVAYPIVTYVFFAFPLFSDYAIRPRARSFSDFERFFELLFFPLPLIVVGFLTLSGSMAGSLLSAPSTRKGGFALTTAAGLAFLAYATAIYVL